MNYPRVTVRNFELIKHRPAVAYTYIVSLLILRPFYSRRDDVPVGRPGDNILLNKKKTNIYDTYTWSLKRKTESYIYRQYKSK